MLPPRTYLSLFNEAAPQPVPAQSVWEPVVITPAPMLPYRGQTEGSPILFPSCLEVRSSQAQCLRTDSSGLPPPPRYPEPRSPTEPQEMHLPRVRPGQAPWAKCQMLSSSWKGWGPGITRHPGFKRKKVVPPLTQLLLPAREAE